MTSVESSVTWTKEMNYISLSLRTILLLCGDMSCSCRCCGPEGDAGNMGDGEDPPESEDDASPRKTRLGVAGSAAAGAAAGVLVTTPKGGR